MRTLLSVAALSGLLVSSLSAQASSTKPVLHWAPAPAVFPKGAKMAVVSGDPGKQGMFAVELMLPSNYRIPPHFHPTDEHVEIKKGTFLVGMGDVLDLKQTRAMAAGDTGSIPALGHHFAATKGAVVLEITSMGPFAMTYINPKDDPRNAKTAGY